jgi:twitching motility two-component system response regulator PilH
MRPALELAGISAGGEKGVDCEREIVIMKLVEKKKVLVVDDDPTTILYVSELLSASGYTVVSAGDGEEGVARAVESPPDLILMDLSMPKVNGFEATRMLRASPRTEKVPIIAMTSLDRTADCESAFVAGCNEHIAKPLKSEELFAKISSLLHLS